MTQPPSTNMQILKPQIDLLAQMGKLNPGFARLAVMLPILAAAAAAAMNYLGNDPAMAFIILVGAIVLLVVLAVISTVAANLLSIPGMAATVVWFVRFMLTVFGMVLVIPLIAWLTDWPRPAACLLNLSPRSSCQVAGVQVPPAPPAPVSPAGIPANNPRAASSLLANYRVFPQYLGVAPPKLATLENSLRNNGWRVEAAENMTGKTTGSWNEIRVNPTMDKDVAKQLADDVSAALRRPIIVNVVSAVRPDRPEIWISGD